MADAAAMVAAMVDWADYASPLSARIAAIRDTICDNARAHGWIVQEEQLDDRHIVRRMILKRVVYGVDKNPMAVELAKVALWLHSFTVGAPLSFLDHHLRCGDSVVGAWVHPTIVEIERRGAFFSRGLIRQVERAAALMEDIERITDNDVSEVAQSKSSFAAEIGRLRQEYRETVEPARRAAAEVLRLERALSDLVNAAYGLTQEEVRLMWQTAPPRLPLDPAEELARLHQPATA